MFLFHFSQFQANLQLHETPPLIYIINFLHSALEINIIYFMITQKSSIKSPSKCPKIVILEINSEGNPTGKNNRFNSHKLRKLQSNDTCHQLRGMKNLDKIDFTQLFQENEFIKQEPFVPPPKNHHHQSSYLAYKAEQKYHKVMHNHKSKFLKSKLLQQKYSLDTRPHEEQLQRPSQTFDVSRAKRKMSMVQLGQCLSEENDEISVLSYSRNVYIKTSEGKRQKINTNTYMNKIKEKIQNFCEKEVIEIKFNGMAAWNDFEQQPIRLANFNQDRPTLTRNIRKRSIKREVVNLKVEQNVNDCRPWTSNKSEAPQ